MDRLGLWPLRVLLAALPLATGAVIADALDGTGPTFRTSCAVGLWAVWGLTMVATLVPLPLTLTEVRVVAPAALLATVWASFESSSLPAVLVGLAGAGAATLAAFHPIIGDRFVDGASYGTERRMALRVPGALLLGPLYAVWLAVVVGLTAGPLLLAAQRWVAGAVALLIGLPVAFLALRSLHALARRWIVFVPNGFVIHDHLALEDPILLTRAAVAQLRAAPADTTAIDLTQGALGLALEIDLETTTKLMLASGRGRGVVAEADAVLVTPTRLAALLTEAESRRLPV